MNDELKMLLEDADLEEQTYESGLDHRIDIKNRFINFFGFKGHNPFERREKNGKTPLDNVLDLRPKIIEKESERFGRIERDIDILSDYYCKESLEEITREYRRRFYGEIGKYQEFSKSAYYGPEGDSGSEIGFNEPIF